MSFRLDDKVAVVTGAAGLLGTRHVHALLGAGARVVAADLTRPSFDAPGVMNAQVDVTDPASLAALRDEALARFDRVDVLVCDAAIDDRFAPGEDGRAETLSATRFRRSLDVNVTGTFLACQAFGAAMAARGAGSLITIGSTYGVVAPDPSLYRRPDGTQAFWKSVAYPASKGAVIAMTRALAAHFGGRGVRVNTLSPGGVENGQVDWFVEAYARRTPLGRMATPGDLDGALLFLASDASSYVTGQNLLVDGGFTAW